MEASCLRLKVETGNTKMDKGKKKEDKGKTSHVTHTPPLLLFCRLPFVYKERARGELFFAQEATLAGLTFKYVDPPHFCGSEYHCL